MLRRAGSERGSFKKVSIVENQMDGNLRRLQENILEEIRNRSAFPLRKVAKDTQRQQELSSDPIHSRQRYPLEGPPMNPQHRHSSLIRTNSLFEEPQISLSDSNSFPLPSPPLPSPPPQDLLPSHVQPVLDQSNYPKTSERTGQSYSSFKNIVRFHENSLEQGNQEQSVYRPPNLRCHAPARGIILRSQSMLHPCLPIKTPCDSEEGADITNRPPSPPLKYSPTEGNFKSSFIRQPSLVIPKKGSAHDISPPGSDVDEAISKAENRRKQVEMRSLTMQRIRKPSGGRLLNLQDPPSPLTYFRPHPQPSVVKYCVTSNQQVEEGRNNKNEGVSRPPQIREPPKILATRGVTPFRRLSRISASSSSSTSPDAAVLADGSSSIDEDGPGGQRGKWVFPTRRSIYAEGGQQAQHELQNSQRKRETSAMPDSEKKPPHHYTGPGMFRGLSPRLPAQLERPRERRSSFTNSTRPFFCSLTNQMESTKPSTKVDRMVSPIPSPLPSQPSVSIYGTLDRSSRTRNRSGTFNPSQNDYDNGGFSTWRLSQFYPGVTASNTGVQSERVTNLGASRISLWSQKTSVEQPEPQRFGSLGRHDDRLIRKYLQRHSSMGSRAFLPETGGGHSFLQYSQR